MQDLIWKLLISLAFVYLATRVPSMLGQAGTFDAWLSTLYFGMSLPGSMVRSMKSVGLIAGGAAGWPRLASLQERLPPERACRPLRARSTRRPPWRLHQPEAEAQERRGAAESSARTKSEQQA